MIAASSPTSRSPQNIAFGLIAAIMVFARDPGGHHQATWCTPRCTSCVVLAGVAAQYILLGAEFVAVTQVLVYIGAIVVLFLFGVMLTRAPIGRDEELDQPQTLARRRRWSRLLLLGRAGLRR